MFCSKTKFFVCFAVLAGMAFAAPPKTWDAIYKAEGEGDYTAVKIVGNIRMGKYTNYKEIQPVSFKVEDGMFSFSASGNMVVPANKIEKENFYQQCDKSKEAWVSYFNKPMTFGKEEQIVHIAGVDLACGDDAYALSDLRIKFTNPKAQEYWAANMEKYEKYKREQVAELRRAEQQHHADIRSMSGSFTDPRDGQTYRTIKVEGREWFAQNVNYEVPGHSWCYEDKENYCTRSGKLYDLEGARKACPEGWHLPDRADFEQLIASAGGTDLASGMAVAGEKLKSTSGWFKKGNGSDEFGFNALPAGYRLGGNDGSENAARKFDGIGGYAHFWSASETPDGLAHYLLLDFSTKAAKLNAFGKDEARSVRCVKE